MNNLIFAFACLISVSVLAQPEPTMKFITEDVENFWKAFDAFKKDTTSNPFGDYLRQGTTAFKRFQSHRIKDSTAFKKIIGEEISYYETLRSSHLKVRDYQSLINEYFKAFKRIYPDAVQPDVYFVMGQLNTGATTNENGIMIGLELFSDYARTLHNGNKTIRFNELPLIIANCMVYFNHKPAHTGYTLLRECIVRGSSDFITSLFLDEKSAWITGKENFLYGQQYEEMLVKEFLQEKDSQNFAKWLSEDAGDRPARLGNWIGFKITEAYYETAADKTKAIDEILKINDFEKFLVLSGYTEQFRN